MFERVKENFFKKIRLKDAILSFILALILLFFSQHLFLDSGYWVEKGNLPDLFKITISYNGNDDNVKIYSLLPNAKKMKRVKYFNNTTTKTITGSINNHFEKYKFIVKINNVKKINLEYNTKFNNIIEFKSIKINDIEFIKRKEKTDNKISISIPQGTSFYNIEVICKKSQLTSKQINIKNYLSAIFIFIFYYFIINLICIKFYTTNTKLLFQNLLNLFKKNKIALLIFIFSFLLYLAYNLKTAILVNHFNRVPYKWGGVTGDEAIVIRNIVFSASRRFHPYFFLPLYPLYEFLMFISNNLYCSLSIIWCFLGSLSCVFLYKSLNLIIPRLKIIKTILLLCFTFTLSQLLMSYIFDLYIIAGCYLSIFIYLVSKELKNKEYDIINMLLIAIITAFIFGVNIPNLITCLIISSGIFIVKKNKKTILSFFLIILLLICSFVSIKSVTDNRISYKNIFGNKINFYLDIYFETNFKNNLTNFYQETLLKPFTYIDCKINNITNPALIFWALFVLTTVFASYLYLSNKAKDDNKALYFSLLAAILYNFCANFFWCPKMGFLFSQNFLVLLFIIMAMSINNIDSYLKTKKYSNCFKYSLIICLSVLLFFEITLNTKTVLRQHNNAIKYNPQNLLLEKR